MNKHTFECQTISDNHEYCQCWCHKDLNNIRVPISFLRRLTALWHIEGRKEIGLEDLLTAIREGYKVPQD